MNHNIIMYILFDKTLSLAWKSDTTKKKNVQQCLPQKF